MKHELTLRSARSSDLQVLLRWRSSAENQRVLMWRTTARSQADVEAWVQRRSADPDGQFAVIALGEAPVGFVQLTRIDRVDGHAQLGLFVDPEHRRKSIASRALTQMTQRARELGLRKLLLEVASDNAAALRFWEGNGFRTLGVLAAHHVHEGKAIDVVLLERLIDAGSAQAVPEALPPIPNESATVRAMAEDPEVRALQKQLFALMGKYRYSYNWTWFGRPIIQLPQDVMAMQMVLLQYQPDLVIETGIAHGGSLVFTASMLELLGRGRVLGIDIDIRSHNRAAIEAHPLAHRISMIQGSSIDPEVARQAAQFARSAKRVMVCLDSNHTADHVAKELELYAPLVTVGQHLVVFDTAVEDMPADAFPDRPWGPGNSPKTAVHQFLATHPSFAVDQELERRLMFSVAPEGYLKRLS